MGTSRFYKPIFAAATVLLSALMIFTGMMFYRDFSRWRVLEDRISRARAVIGAFQNIADGLHLAESAARGFMLAAAPSEEETLRAGITGMEEGTAELLRLGEQSKENRHEREIAALPELIKKRKEILLAGVTERKRLGRVSESMGRIIEKARRTTLQIEDLIKTGQDVERRHLVLLEAESKALAAQRGWLTTSLFLLTFTAVVFALIGALLAARRNRMAGEALADANARLKSVMSAASQIAIISTDTTGKITVFNTGAEKMLGYKAEELVGSATPAIFHDPAEVEARGRELSEKLGKPVSGFSVFIENLASNAFENREWTYISKSGRRFPVELVVTGVKDHNGATVGFLGMATDISERKSSELRLRKLSAAVESSPTSIVITDADGNIEYSNPKFLQLTGYNWDELKGQNPRIIASGKTPKTVYEDMWSTLLSGRTWEGDLLNKKKDGELFWEHASISPVTGHDGRIESFVAVKLDITDRIAAQRETEKARDAAMELARMKSEFLANMSHEIRTPMNAIIGMTGLLLETPLTERQRDYLKTVSGAGEALLDIINDILDFSKIESGKLVIENVDFSLRDTIETTADLLAPRAQSKGLEVVHFIDPTIPAGLNGDQGRLRQILMNLIGNAIKFTERGEVVIRVEPAGDTATDLKFSISDTGIGVSEEAQKDLFQVFTQADASTTRKYGGTGLGLSISKRLVELMGGEIGVKSVQGKGSTFWFRIPFRPSEKPVPEETEHIELSGLRALIVDDNPANREILTRHLEAWGIIPSAVPSAAEALAALKSGAAGPDGFRLVLMDMQMPDMDGLQLAREINRDPALSGTARIMMTSLGRGLGREELSALGLHSCLDKPVRPRLLLEHISRAVTGKAAAAERSAQGEVPSGSTDRTKKYFRVLVAEDNIVNQKVSLKQLESLGYEADVAANGREALEALARRPYDLVLMDCQMPEMDGFQATEEIRKREAGGRRTPIVALTANAMQGDKEKCDAAGMDGYIPKPVRIEQLAAALARWDSSLDPASMDYLKELGGADTPGFMAELASVYLGDLPERMEAIRKAREAGDPEKLRQAAHALKGSSGNMGAMRMQKICLRLEELGASGSADVPVDLAEELESEAASLKSALEALIREQEKKPS